MVPDVEAVANHTALPARDRRLDGKRELDRADVCNTSVEEGPRGSAPDRRRVHSVRLHVSSLASLDDRVCGGIVRQSIVVRDKIVVVVLGDPARWRVTSGTEVSPDTSAGGVDVDGRLAGGLEALLRAGEESGGGGEVEDVGLLRCQMSR